MNKFSILLKSKASKILQPLSRAAGLPTRMLPLKMGVALAIFLGGYFFISITFAIFIALLFILVSLNCDYRIPLVLAFFSLIACSFLLIAGNKSGAEQVGFWAFYFMAMALASMLINDIRGDTRDQCIKEDGEAKE